MAPWQMSRPVSIPISALAFKEHKFLCLLRRNVPGSAAALAEPGSLPDSGRHALLCTAVGVLSHQLSLFCSLGFQGCFYSFVDG